MPTPAHVHALDVGVFWDATQRAPVLPRHGTIPNLRRLPAARTLVQICVRCGQIQGAYVKTPQDALDNASLQDGLVVFEQGRVTVFANVTATPHGAFAEAVFVLDPQRSLGQALERFLHPAWNPLLLFR